MIISRDESFEIVDAMDLDEGHVLTDREAFAIHDVLQEANALRIVRRALGIEGDE